MTLVTLFVWGSPALADCSASETFTRRVLFANFGLYPTTGTAGTTFVECSSKDGFYGNVFAVTPFREFDHGKEIDLRAGWRTAFGQLGIDASVAAYRLSDGNSFSTFLDGRMRMEYRLDVGPRLTFLPYVGVDLLGLTSDWSKGHSVFGGVAGNIKLTESLAWNTDAALWHHIYWDVAHGAEPNVWSVKTGPSLKLSDGVFLDARYTHSWGGVLSQGYNKSAAEVGLTVRF
jgi:hypothetical protein